MNFTPQIYTKLIEALERSNRLIDDLTARVEELERLVLPPEEYPEPPPE